MELESSFCVKCNRNKKKGEWEETVMLNPERNEIETKHGTKYFLKGTCAVCGKKVTKMIHRPR